MHDAPSVMYPVGRCALYARVLLLLALCTGALIASWTWYTREDWLSAVGAAGFVGWLFWIGFAVRSWCCSPVGYLRWCPSAPNGSNPMCGGWLWHDRSDIHGVVLQRLESVLDLQGWILLRFRDPSTLSMRWAWVERARDPTRWGDLRRALVAHRN